jgi:ferredoxin
VIFGAKDVLDVIKSQGKVDLEIECEMYGPCSTGHTGVYEPLVEKYWLSENL